MMPNKLEVSVEIPVPNNTRLCGKNLQHNQAWKQLVRSSAAKRKVKVTRPRNDDDETWARNCSKRVDSSARRPRFPFKEGIAVTLKRCHERDLIFHQKFLFVGMNKRQILKGQFLQFCFLFSVFCSGVHVPLPAQTCHPLAISQLDQSPVSKKQVKSEQLSFFTIICNLESESLGILWRGCFLCCDVI